MSNETCPHCGAVLQISTHSKIYYTCGSYQSVRLPVTNSDVDVELKVKIYRNDRCYERQFLSFEKEIEELKKARQAVVEECAKLVEDFIETKKGWHTGDLLAAIRARGEVK